MDAGAQQGALTFRAGMEAIRSAIMIHIAVIANIDEIPMHVYVGILQDGEIECQKQLIDQ